MKWTIPVLFIFAFFGCQQPLDEEAIRQAVQTVIEEPEEEEPEEPEPVEETWTAEARHIYLYPESVEPDGTNYEKLYIADLDDDYSWLYNAAKMKLESHNRDYPDDQWVIIGGGP